MIDILDYYDCGQSRGQPITDAANDHREAIRGRVGDLGAWLVRRLGWDQGKSVSPRGDGVGGLLDAAKRDACRLPERG